MSTDEMIEKENLIPEFGAEIPFVQPQPTRVKRLSGVFGRLRQKQTKAETFIKAIQFAAQLIGYQMKSKPMQKSVKLQYGLTTRQARAAIQAAKPKKHRARH